MGAGCSKGASGARRVSSPTIPDRIRTHTLGNFTFQVYGNLYSEQKKAGNDFRMTPAWETTATREEVDRKRKEFWDTRVEGDLRVWETLRNILNITDISKIYIDQAKLMIQLSGLKMMGDFIMVTYDETGRRYDLPPFLINEPEKYGTAQEAPKIPQDYQEKKIPFRIRCTKFSDYDSIEGSLSTLQQIKVKYAEHLHLNWEKVRLFYNGKECKNEFTLLQCGIEDGVVIQAAVGI